jgi:hypothetical protein
MSKIRVCVLLAGIVLFPLLGWAQMPGFAPVQGERVDAEVALDRALQKSSLTFQGKPFHAVMEIWAQGIAYSGRVEVWWINDSKYRVALTSPKALLLC